MNTTTTGEAVRYEVREDVAFITLDAPPVNVLTAAIMRELATASSGRRPTARSRRSCCSPRSGRSRPARTSANTARRRRRR